MKEEWCKKKAQELQKAADIKDSKGFFSGLKAVYGPKSSGSTPVLNADESSLLTDKGQIFGRWAEHFNKILNCPSTVSDAALDEIEQLSVLEHLSMAPTVPEVQKATRQMSTGKAAGPDGIPADVYKLGGPRLIRELTSLYARCGRRKQYLRSSVMPT